MKKGLLCFILFILTIFSGFTASFIKVSAQEETPSSEKQALEEKLTELYKKDLDAGTYPVKIQYEVDGHLIKKTIFLTLKSKNTKIEGNIGINANDVVIYQDEVNQMQKEDWLGRTKAKAWQIDDPQKNLQIEVDVTKIEAKEGTYLLTLTTINQIQTTAKINVVKRPIPNAYQKNIQLAWFEEKQKTFSWELFESAYEIFLKASFVAVLLLPFLILLFEYVATSKLVKRVMQLILQPFDEE